MPQTNVVYGKSYRTCPCAQIHDEETTNTTYFTVTCYSPKRKPCKLTDWRETGICMGRTYQGKRYTSCPYYVRNAKINVPKRTKSNSLGNIAFHVGGFIIFFAIAAACMKGDLKVTWLSALFFGALAIIWIAPLFMKSDIMDNPKKNTDKKDRKKK